MHNTGKSMNGIQYDERGLSPELTDTFALHRPKVLGLAYRITSSRHDAEDITQECFLKWLAADHATITSPEAWLVTVSTHIALDHLKKARGQRESYVGPWLPEPFIDTEKSPEQEHELDESISMALLVLLEQLSPAERGAYILHDLFHFSFDEISAILKKTSPACRKLASRARQKIARDTQALTTLLRDEVTLTADGGSKAAAVPEVLQGLDAVASFLLQVVSPSFTAEPQADISKTVAWFNGTPGIVIWSNQQPISAFNFEIEDHRISQINVLRNPDKLRLFKSL